MKKLIMTALLALPFLLSFAAHAADGQASYTWCYQTANYLNNNHNDPFWGELLDYYIEVGCDINDIDPCEPDRPENPFCD